jgi:hypothetical protein
MTRRTARWILWLGFAATLPLPFFLVVSGRVPPLRLVELGAVSVAIMVVEGSQGVVGLVAAILLGQALAYLTLLWFVCDGLSRVVERFGSRALALFTLATLLVVFLSASFFDLYRTPFRPDAPTANLFHVYR